MEKDQNANQWNKVDLIEYFMPICQILYNNQNGSEFRNEVDEKNVPNYYDIIKTPISLTNIMEKLKSGKYPEPWSVVDDFWMMFENCKTFNKKGSRVYKMGENLADLFVKETGKLMKNLGFCCAEKHYYEPHFFNCDTVKDCKIKTGQRYYKMKSKDQQFFICDKCYAKSVEYIDFGDMNLIPKNSFYEYINSSKVPETFVVCATCSRKWHTVCAMYYDTNDPFYCSNCKMECNISIEKCNHSSDTIPTSNLSKYIENRVNNLLKESESSKVAIRDFINNTKCVCFKPEMKKLFIKKEIHMIPYTSRAIYAFQKIDGVDVLFYGLHTQEYPIDSVEPNKGTVYIMYMDSVTFFKPLHLRTQVYQEIILSYFDFIRKNGFTRIHLWICPAEIGNDYIFNCHPIEQKMPNNKRLKAWYELTFRSGISRSIITKYESIEEYYKNITSPTDLAYFDGDHWPNALESLMKNIKCFNKTAESSIKYDKIKIYSCLGAKKQKTDFDLLENFVQSKLIELLKLWKEDFMIVHLKKDDGKEYPTEDQSKILNYEVFETRDSILPFCKDNNLEFSTLRRAKYSTMRLIIEAIKNNKQQGFHCNECYTNNMIIRYHCNICIDFDLCDTCYKNKRHFHVMTRIGPLNNELSLEEVSDLVVHSSSCQFESCSRKYCLRLKQLILHTKFCKKNSCEICLQVGSARATHYYLCKFQNCGVEMCMTKKKEYISTISKKELEVNNDLEGLLNAQKIIVSNKIIELLSQYKKKEIAQVPFNKFMHEHPEYIAAYKSIKSLKVLTKQAKTQNEHLSMKSHQSEKHSLSNTTPLQNFPFSKNIKRTQDIMYNSDSRKEIQPIQHDLSRFIQRNKADITPQFVDSFSCHQYKIDATRSNAIYSNFQQDNQMMKPNIYNFKTINQNENIFFESNSSYKNYISQKMFGIKQNFGDVFSDVSNKGRVGLKFPLNSDRKIVEINPKSLAYLKEGRPTIIIKKSNNS